MSFPEKKSCIILVEGTGHVVQHNYGPALKIEKDQHGDELSVIFAGLREKPAKEAAQNDQERFIASLDDWKAKYINKSSPEGKKEYESLNPTVVFVATPDSTHVQLAFNWLSEKHKSKHIFIEKPIDSSLSRARVLQFYSEKENSEHEEPVVFAIDHYLARFIPFRYTPILKALLRELGGTIQSLSFHLLEDRSAAFTGPIEEENRSSSLQKGLILDLFPHILAILTYFGSIESVRVSGLNVARYNYEAEDGSIVEASIPRETFAHISFSFISLAGKKITADAYLGKGISGSTELGIKGDVKRLELVGKNGRKCRFDLRNTDHGGTGKVEIINKDGMASPDLFMELYPEPYPELVHRVVDKYLHNPAKPLGFSLSLQQAKDCLTCIHEILSLVELFEKTKNPIPSYTIKTARSKEGQEPASVAPTLEEVMRELPDVRKIIKVSDLLGHYENSQEN
jgi:predicted dehydrogenase